MLYIILAAIITLSYLMIGLRTARAQYVIEFREYVKAVENPVMEVTAPLGRIEWSKQNSTLYVHNRACNYFYPALFKDSGCECSNGHEAYKKYHRESLKAQPKPVTKPSPSLANVVFWPGVLTRQYIASGAEKIPDPIEIEALQRSIGMD